MAEVRALVVEAKAPAADVMVVGAGAAKRELGGATALEDGARATVAVMVPDTQGTAEAARVGGTAVVAMVPDSKGSAEAARARVAAVVLMAPDSTGLAGGARMGGAVAAAAAEAVLVQAEAATEGCLEEG